MLIYNTYPWEALKFEVTNNIRDKENMIYTRNLLKDAFIFISVGGDGTLLSALKMALETSMPVLPIYHGTLGFIAEITSSDAFLILEEYLENKTSNLYRVENRICLSIDVIYKNKPHEKFHAINEVVIEKPMARPIHLNTEIENRPILSLVGDGVVISTPTGSTAYALSAGGPIISPSLKALAFVPIAPHSLTLRPLIIPHDSNIKICLKEQSENALISIDGDISANISNGDFVSISSSSKNFFLFQSSNRKFYTTLREKLNWGK